jgi:hypothetical protein
VFAAWPAILKTRNETTLRDPNENEKQQPSAGQRKRWEKEQKYEINEDYTHSSVLVTGASLTSLSFQL